MKASELITILQGLVAEHGDCRVFGALDWDDVSSVSVQDAAARGPFVPPDGSLLSAAQYAKWHAEFLERHPEKEFWLE